MPLLQDTPETPAPPARRRRWIAAAAAALAAGLLSLPLAPGPARPADPVTGDTALAEQARELLGDHPYTALSVALREDGVWRTAGFGEAGGAPVTPDTPFETGSVHKTLTGMLLAELIEEGEIAAGTTLADAFPDTHFADPDLAATTLEELSGHQSGLPSTDPSRALAGLLPLLSRGDPYAGLTAEDVIAAAAAAEVPESPGYGYSNLGVSLLGEAMARLTGTPYQRLLDERVLGPLGMDATVVATAPAEVPDGAAWPHDANGVRVSPWYSAGYAPSGTSTWSTGTDLTRLLDAVADGSAPGAAATEPRFPAGEGTEVGLGWHRSRIGGEEIVWHNGGTGGTRAFVGYAPATGSAVVVTGTTTEFLDSFGMRLLGADVPAAPGSGQGPVLTAVTALLCLAGGLFLLEVGTRRLSGTRLRPAPHRAGTVSASVSALAVLALAHSWGAWALVPPALWTLGAALTAFGITLAAGRWPRLPLTRGHRALGPAVSGLSIAFSLTLACLALWPR
ncbi:serine hydrolase domain-containing protein [Allonocardiopsis opalescens]|uniref:CubicO group peptidase (Beta-lactamase class C family) n=1 Tax=Allonocardiopsis opalescens TaxID=1144618 RepID=A0A2T0Q4M1_9ACTN|nr:serine hydrolase domain-containing protein [Allonocardiopsis opalescens]PRX98758.1 CubicO group peptidase (beta-lactamase class C family) [Allonocardiopsis opalescens]